MTKKPETIADKDLEKIAGGNYIPANRWRVSDRVRMRVAKDVRYLWQEGRIDSISSTSPKYYTVKFFKKGLEPLQLLEEELEWIGTY